MIKRIGILTVAVILITCLVGCGGGSSSNGGDNGKTVTDADILALFSKYETAVEAYNVTEMLDCLDSSNFTLTINEGSYSNTKDYPTLKTELENDKDCQLAWREPSTVTGGHNYKLDLVLGTPTSDNKTSSGAVVTQSFEVWESSDEIAKIKTDSGTIVWTLVQSSGEWKATAMTINYNIVTSASVKAALLAGNKKAKGFGFGRSEI